MTLVPTLFLLSSNSDAVAPLSSLLEQNDCQWPICHIKSIDALYDVETAHHCANDALIIFKDALALETDTLVELAERRAQNGQLTFIVSDALKPDDALRFLSLDKTDCCGSDELYRIIGVMRKFLSACCEQALEHQKHLSQYFLDVANVMIVAVNQAMEIVLINQKGAQILGYSVDELMGKNWIHCCVPVDAHASARQFFSQYFNREIYRLDYTETPVLTKNGDVKLIGWHNTLLDTQDFNETVIISSGQDITDEHLIWQRKDTFVATLTHDLKTPIRAEYQALELILNESFGPLTTDLREVMSEMKRSNRFMQRMVDNLLAIYKYEDRQIKLDIQPTDLNALIQSGLAKDVVALADEKKQSIQMHLDADITELNLDATEIKQVIGAIVHNAVLFSPEGSPITISTHNKNGSIEVSVEDVGQGIAPDVLKNLFNRYSGITKKFRQVGTGLSLYLARQIVEAHGGQISVNSSLGEGSQFIFTLPVRQANHQPV